MRFGEALPSVVRSVKQDKISLYAEAGGDHNPLHLDDEFASGTHFGRIVAHGMLVLAYVSDMMALAFGRGWLEIRAAQRALPSTRVPGRHRLDLRRGG